MPNIKKRHSLKDLILGKKQKAKRIERNFLVERFASHWKHQNRQFRTLTKAFGLRFIFSVSGQAGRFDVITVSLNIGSLIGILGLATFICDIVALYVHRQSNVYRQQKFQDVDLNLVRLETLNSLPLDMTNEENRRNYDHIIDNNHIQLSPLSLNNKNRRESTGKSLSNIATYNNLDFQTVLRRNIADHYPLQLPVDLHR